MFGVFKIMAPAIVASGVSKAVMAKHVACFPERNRMYEVFGLFALLPVGIVLMNEDGNPAFLRYRIDFMRWAIFYIAQAALVLVESGAGALSVQSHRASCGQVRKPFGCSPVKLASLR
ncbi:MAG: hypothetical protein HKP56_15465 [Anderseniella sp.]|nr:hypothetical protein [Anderseniella sp.]